MRGSVLFASAALVLAPVVTGCDDDADSLSGHPAAAGAGQAGSAPFDPQSGAGGDEERGGANATGGSANEPSAGDHASAGTRNPSGRGGTASGAAGRSAGRGGDAGSGAGGRAGAGASGGAGGAAGTNQGGGAQAGSGGSGGSDSSGGTSGTGEGGTPSDAGAPTTGGSGGTSALPELHICDRLSEPAFTVYDVVISRYDPAVWSDCRVRGFVYNYLAVSKRDEFTTDLMNDSLRLWGCSSQLPSGFTLIWGTPSISRADVDVLLSHYLEATDAEVLLSDTERKVLAARVRALAEPLVVDELEGFSQSRCPPDAGAGGEGGGAGAGPGGEAGRADGS